MLGRKEELNHLNELYNSDCFEYLVMYGRRRVGKTTILQEFAEHSNAIFFPAREKNDALNLEDFSKVIQYHFYSFIYKLGGCVQLYWREGYRKNCRDN